MAVPDSTTIQPAFITDRPDFSQPMQLISTHATAIATATDGADQRARLRSRPRYSFSYFIAAMTIREFSIRRSKMIQELTAPIVCPIWTDIFLLASMTDANTVELATPLALKKFKVNSYAFFVQGTNQSFRLITAVNTTSLTFEAGSFPTYTAGAKIYPCIFGRRQQGQNSFTANGIADMTEQLTIEEL